jgi:hypothetical protein
MFNRRLYFLFPDTAHARAAVRDLDGLAVKPDHIHTVARADMDLGDLPVATDPQRHDALALIEKGLWHGNLLVFALATAVLAAAVVAGSMLWSVLALAVMVITVAGGSWFAMRAPHTHLDEFHQAIRHGEILLMVDVTRDCIEEIEAMMQRRHPESVAGGSGWTPGLFGV